MMKVEQSWGSRDLGDLQRTSRIFENRISVGRDWDYTLTLSTSRMARRHIMQCAQHGLT